jgi:hypothetical protein
MASKIDVFNMALGHIGVSSTVNDELERSPERVICSRYWDSCRDGLLAYKSMPWGFANALKKLAMLPGDPPAGWEYRYRYPNDCINAIEIYAESVRTTSVELRSKYHVAYEADGRVILCDIPEATLRYTKRVAEVERWPAPFVEAMSFRLASMIVMGIKNDAGVMGSMLQLAEQFAQIAMAADFNEQQPDGPIPSIYERELHA